MVRFLVGYLAGLLSCPLVLYLLVVWRVLRRFR